METIGSKRSYALIWCMPNNDDDESRSSAQIQFLAVDYNVTDCHAHRSHSITIAAIVHSPPITYETAQIISVVKLTFLQAFLHKLPAVGSPYLHQVSSLISREVCFQSLTQYISSTNPNSHSQEIMCEEWHRRYQVLSELQEILEIDCDQSNVYSSRTIFLAYSSEADLSSLSLHTVGRLATIPCKIRSYMCQQ